MKGAQKGNMEGRDFNTQQAMLYRGIFYQNEVLCSSFMRPLTKCTKKALHRLSPLSHYGPLLYPAARVGEEIAPGEIHPPSFKSPS